MTTVQPYGTLIKVDNVVGLLHISRLSDTLVKSMDEVFKVRWQQPLKWKATHAMMACYVWGGGGSDTCTCPPHNTSGIARPATAGGTTQGKSLKGASKQRLGHDVLPVCPTSY